jgi:hypothetical protein
MQAKPADVGRALQYKAPVALSPYHTYSLNKECLQFGGFLISYKSFLV